MASDGDGVPCFSVDRRADAGMRTSPTNCSCSNAPGRRYSTAQLRESGGYDQSGRSEIRSALAFFRRLYLDGSGLCAALDNDLGQSIEQGATRLFIVLMAVWISISDSDKYAVSGNRESEKSILHVSSIDRLASRSSWNKSVIEECLHRSDRAPRSAQTYGC